MAMYGVYTKVFSFVKYSSGFCVADVSKIKKSHYFLWKGMQSFQFMVHTYLNYFSKTNSLITFQEQTTIYYKELKVIVYITTKYMYVRFLPLTIGDLNLVMYSHKGNDILITRLLLVSVSHNHHVFLFVVDIKD